MQLPDFISLDVISYMVLTTWIIVYDCLLLIIENHLHSIYYYFYELDDDIRLF